MSKRYDELNRSDLRFAVLREADSPAGEWPFMPPEVLLVVACDVGPLMPYAVWVDDLSGDAPVSYPLNGPAETHHDKLLPGVKWGDLNTIWRDNDPGGEFRKLGITPPKVHLGPIHDFAERLYQEVR